MKPTWIARAATLSLVLLPCAKAWAQAPFAPMPADANVLARVDFDDFAAAPAWSGFHRELAAKAPDHRRALLILLANEFPHARSLSDEVAAVSGYELGARYDATGAPPAGELTDHRFGLVIHGDCDAPGVARRLRDEAWLAGSAAGEQYLVAPDGRISARAAGADALVVNRRLVTAPAPTEAPDVSPAFRSTTATVTQTSPLVLGFGLTTAQRSQLEAMTRSLPDQTQAIAGLRELLDETPHVQYGILAVDSVRSKPALSLRLGYSDSAAAARAVAATNKLVPALAELGRAQAAGDPLALEQIDAIAALRAQAAEADLMMLVPVPDDYIPLLADAVAAVVPTPSNQPAPSLVARTNPEDPNQPLRIELLDEPAGDSPALNTRPSALTSSKPATRSTATRAMGPSADGSARRPSGLVFPAGSRRPLPLGNLRGIDGDAISFSRSRGKVVLIDFWATWCGPCRQAMPTVIALNNKMAGRDFEIVGISLDTDLKALRRYTRENDMPWPQVCDGKGWDSEYAQTMQVSGIPFSVLVDKQGKIAAVNLPEHALETAVTELLDEAP